jgi:LysM repeat protein
MEEDAMSVASEFPPEVFIPERARRSLSGQPVGRHLALVPVSESPNIRRPAAPAARRAFAESSVAWPVTVTPSAPPLRLTRRGLVAAVATTVLLALVMLAVARMSAPHAAPAPAAAPGVVTVQSGDTLWSIAQRVAPGDDPRAVVARLEHVNHLGTLALRPGQTLNVG